MEINISEHHPERQLQALHLTARTSQQLVIQSVPERYDSVIVALKRNEGHFRIEAYIVRSGAWIADIMPGHIPTAWDGVYEVYGIMNEMQTRLGGGRLTVKEPRAFGAAAEPIDPATLLPMYDDEGMQHTLRLVKLENGDYTIQVD